MKAGPVFASALGGQDLTERAQTLKARIKALELRVPREEGIGTASTAGRRTYTLKWLEKNHLQTNEAQESLWLLAVGIREFGQSR